MSLSNIIFLTFLLLVPLFSFNFQQIPVSIDEDHYTLGDEFRSKYGLFSLVGERLKTKLTNILSTIITQNFPESGFCLVPPVKQPFSLKRKMDLEITAKEHNGYLYKDFEDVKDFVRSSLIFSSLDDVYEAAKSMESIFGEILKKDDTFDKIRSPFGKGKTGYRDLSYNFNIKQSKFGMKPNETMTERGRTNYYYMRFEVQLHVCGIFLAKQIGHSIYELTRVISQINEKNEFDKIVPEFLREGFYGLFLKVKEILPNNKESQMLIESFDDWKANKNDGGLVRDLVNNLKELSKAIYDNALQTDQNKCVNALKEAITNDSCTFNDGVDLEEISKDFVKKIMQNS